MSAIILGIETSCDETAAAVVRDGQLLSSCVASQDIHRAYGGVVPELASRAHQSAIVPVVHQALIEAGLNISDITGVAFTQGPGLLGALMVGASFAKGLALANNLKLLPIHHMQAHILAHFIESPVPEFPFLCLTVSGGHTQIVIVRDYFQMEILGETIDDAAGEAYDKAAKMLGLDYPGGPIIDQLAATGNANRFTFSEAAVGKFDFSFSGLKTSILYFLRDQVKLDPGFVQKHLNDICASVQFSINHVLYKKMLLASKETGIQTIALAGGVSANSGLRSMFEEGAKAHHWQLFIPPLKYCTDNAAMVAMAGYFSWLKGGDANLDVSPLARMSFIEI